jgi:CRISPR-associated protein Csm1
MTKNRHIHHLCAILFGAGPAPTPETKHVLDQAATAALGKSFTLVPYQPEALRPILAGLGGESVSSFYFRPTALQLRDHFFPVEARPELQALQHQFNGLKTKLQEAGDHDDKILLALEQYGCTLAVNAAFNEISLFDFIRLTAGIADCLTVEGNDQSHLSIINCRVSGIQKYLYDIVSKKASLNLKGRSFYLQLMVDSILLALQRELELSKYHVVFNSGGTFTLIAPGTEIIKAKLQVFKEDMALRIYEQYQTKLFVEIELSAPFEAGHSYRKLYADLNQELQKQRRLRLKTFLQEESRFKELFMPSDLGGLQKRDAITNEEFNAVEQKAYDSIQYKGDELGKAVTFLDWKEDSLAPEENTAVKRSTEEQIRLGRELSDAGCWVIGNESLKSQLPKKTLEVNVLDLPGIFHYFPDARPQLNGKSQVIVMNKVDTADPFVLYGGNKVPINPSKARPRTFDELAECPGSLKRLGFLRMDVDNLGANIAKSADSFARHSAISRSLDWFFKGYLNTLRESEEAYYEQIIILYSGGDDLFILGRWDAVLNFAFLIRDEFRKWVCRNPLLTISGGMAIVPDKFPTIQAARLAKEAENIAKMGDKNAFCLFDRHLSWDKDVQLIRDLKSLLSKALKDEDINRSFLQKVQTHSASKEYQQNFGKTERWRWIAAYDFFQFGKKSSTEGRRLVDTLKEAVITDYYDQKQYKHFLTLLSIAARLVEMEKRTHQSNQTE